MAWQTDFLVEATAGLVGVFIGVLLALWTDRRRQRADQQRDENKTRAEFADLRDAVLASVVKNTVEVKKAMTALQNDRDPYLLGITLERAVWDAAQSHFMRLAPIDDRLLLSRFFDHVHRLDRLLDFYREAKADERLQSPPAAASSSAEIAQRLAEVAEDVRLEGIIIVTDHGNDTQKRLLGLKMGPMPLEETVISAVAPP